MITDPMCLEELDALEAQLVRAAGRFEPVEVTTMTDAERQYLGSEDMFYTLLEAAQACARERGRMLDEQRKREATE